MVGSRRLLPLGWSGERLSQKGKNLDTPAAGSDDASLDLTNGARNLKSSTGKVLQQPTLGPNPGP